MRSLVALLALSTLVVVADLTATANAQTRLVYTASFSGGGALWRRRSHNASL